MTVVCPQNYHAIQALEKRRVVCVSQDEALKQDIRALRIGILNIMPQAETYEFSLLLPLGRSIIQIEPVWIRLKNHQYKSSDAEHLKNLYLPFDEAVGKKRLDGLIVTGAPVESIPFEEVTYWSEIQEILAYARQNIASALGICWGGLALAQHMGIEPQSFPKKLFGVYQIENIDPSHGITGELDDVFWCPMSSHAGVPDNVLKDEQNKSNVRLLAHSLETGYVIFESADQKFLMHLGHPEYASNRLADEYVRDMKKGRTDVDPPKNLDMTRPVNRWRSHCFEFFSQWIKYVHETTPF